MSQKIQRLFFLSAAMSMLGFVCEPVIPLIQPALAATGRDIVTAPQDNSQGKTQRSSQIDQRAISRKNEPTRATATPHRLLRRSTSPQNSAETSNDVSLQPSSSTSPVTLSGS